MDDNANHNNGIVQFWIDGISKGYSDTMNYSDGDTEILKGWEDFIFTHNKADTQNTMDTYIDFDDMAVYGTTPPNVDSQGRAYIGPLGSSTPDTVAPASPSGLSVS